MAWARLVHELALWLFSVVGCMFNWIILFKVCSVWIWLYYMIYGLELMILVWLCEWHMIGWLVKYWHEIGMHDKSIIGWWDMAMVWVRNNSMNLFVRVHGGASYNGHNSMNSWWEFMVVPHIMDVIPWTSWWEFMVVSHVMDVIPWPLWLELMVVPRAVKTGHPT